MARASAAGRRRRREPALSAPGGISDFPLSPRRLQFGPRAPWALLLVLLACGVSPCKGAPVASQGEQLQVWNKISNVCSTYLTSDTSAQSANAFQDLCVMVRELLQKTQEVDEKDTTKRSSVLHPLLEIIPPLHERRLKRNNEDYELRIPGGIKSSGYFLFRPRNGRRSASFS